MNTTDLDGDFLLPRRWPAPTDGAAWKDTIRYLDRQHGEAASDYNEVNWTLADTIKWIAERTQTAVNRLSIHEAAAERAVGELQQALERGEIRASGTTSADPLPRELRPETWGIHEMCLRDDGHLLWPIVVHHRTEDQHVLDVRLRRRDVLQSWPPFGHSPAGPVSTQGRETACKRWLAAMMSADRDKPPAKKAVRDEASTKFPGLAKRAFDRAWTAAIEDTGADAWGAPGRRR